VSGLAPPGLPLGGAVWATIGAAGAVSAAIGAADDGVTDVVTAVLVVLSLLGALQALTATIAISATHPPSFIVIPRDPSLFRTINAP